MERIHRADLGRENRKMRRTKPPKFAARILSLLSSSKKTGILGDTEEEYRMIRSEKGRFKADVWYVWQIFRPLPFFIRSTLYWSITMFKNYSKIFLRNMRRNKIYSLINIVGLAIGLTAVIFILLYVQHELSFDRFHENTGRIYRVIGQYVGSSGIRYSDNHPPALSPTLQDEYPEVVYSARLRRVKEKRLLSCQEKKFFEENIYYADPTVLKIFSITFIYGNPETALGDPYSIVISEEMMKKYFGNEDPIGKTIHYIYEKTIFKKKEFDLRVTGVVKNMPRNSILQFDFIVPFDLNKRFLPFDFESWGWYDSIETYVLLGKNALTEDFVKKIEGLFKSLVQGSNKVLDLQPLEDIKLYGLNNTGAIKNVRIFTILALITMFIASINFMNLSTARSSQRAKEIGMRKIVGAKKRDVVLQFMGESLLLSSISFVLSMIFIFLLLPTIHKFIEEEILIDVLFRFETLAAAAVIVLITGIFSGIYPAFFLSSYKPVSVVKGISNIGRVGHSKFIRKTLVVVQFSLSVILIICTLIMLKQFHFINERNLGFDREHIVFMEMYGNLEDKYEIVKNELLKNQNITAVTASHNIPNTGSFTIGHIDWEGRTTEEEKDIDCISVDFDYFEMLNIEFIDGRSFSKDISVDEKGESYIINERAVDYLGIKNPVGKWLALWGRKGQIIGIVKDFHYESLRNEITPLSFTLWRSFNNYLLIKIKPENRFQTIAEIKRICHELNPAYPFEFRFIDEAIDNQYRNDLRLSQLYKAFTVISIFIACMGLFGLAAFTAEQRTKEIGIRKVLGASLSGVIFLLSKNYIKWVILAIIIALPVAYFSMDHWLRNFAYRIALDVWIFIFAGIVALGIALLTVSYQTIKSATANPVDSLRYE